jgi:hypothetical protein
MKGVTACSSPDDPAYAQTQRFRLGVAYMMAMGVCGIVLVAIGSNLSK